MKHLIAFAALCPALAVLAQTEPAPVPNQPRSVGAQSPTMRSSMAGGSGWSLLPGTRGGYVGLNVGKPDYDLRCAPGFGCDDPSVGAHLYTGGLFNDWIGGEVGYVWLGSADRAGGDVRVDGVNLSLVVRAPFGPVSVYAKGGATYARARVSADAFSGATSGRRTDWAGAYGAGVGFDLAAQSSVVLEWMRHEVKVPGLGRRDIDMTSLGYVYRF